MTAPLLTTERLTLRPPIPADLDPWVAFLASERGRWHGGGPEGGTARAWRIAAAMFGHWQIHGFGPFTCVETTTGRPVASVGPYKPVDWPEGEIGWSVLDPADEGRGFATEAARAVLHYLAHDLGWATVVSYITPANTRSVALARRLGAAPDPVAAPPHAGDIVFRHPVATGAAA